MVPINSDSVASSINPVVIRNPVSRTLALHKLAPVGARLRASNLRVTIREDTTYIADEHLVTQELGKRARKKIAEMIDLPVVVEFTVIPKIAIRSQVAN